MKEFKEYIKAKIALEKELENTQEMLKQTIKEMLLLRNEMLLIKMQTMRC